ncbi:hypothetical protein Tco_0071455 [Tanacetum coccineum]
MILDLLPLSTPLLEETLFIYLTTSKEAFIVVLLAVWKGRQYQPIKQVLSRAEALGKLAQYSVELGAYNITYEPHNAIKGKILADFINEVPVGSETMVPRSTPYTVDHQKVCREEWIIYTDGASSVKRSGVGLVLVSPTKT